MGKKAADTQNLLFGNMGPEFLNWVVEPPTFPIEDLTCFARIDTDSGAIFVRADSPFKTIDKEHTRIPAPRVGFGSPQSNDVCVDERGLIYLLDRNAGLDILEFQDNQPE